MERKGNTLERNNRMRKRDEIKTAENKRQQLDRISFQETSDCQHFIKKIP